MRRHNPAVIPRNHHVEEALEAATSAGDFSVMERLLDVLATPYDHGRDLPAFSASGSDRSYRTFCGTLDLGSDRAPSARYGVSYHDGGG